MRFKTDQSKEKKDDKQEEAPVETVSEVVEVTSPVVKEVPALTHLAVGLYHNVQTNQFHLIKLNYNPLTLQAGNVTVGLGTSRVEAEYEVKTVIGGEIF